MRPKFVAYSYERKGHAGVWKIHLATRIEIGVGGQGFASGRFEVYALCGAYASVEAIEFDEPSPTGVETETCAECVVKAKELSAS